MEIKPRIFIAASTEGRKIASAIQQNLRDTAFPEPWYQSVFEPSGTVLDSLLKQLDEMDAAICLFTPDDETRSRNNEHMTARDNVVFELGLFMGRLGKKVCFVVTPNLPPDKAMRFPTDLLGIISAHYDVEHAKSNPRSALGPACEMINDSLRKHFRPRGGIQRDERVVYFLRGIKETYLRHLSDMGLLPVRARLNIMAPNKHDHQAPSLLQIIYADYLADYNEEELKDGYKQGQGKCGQAWQNGKQAIYARDIRSEITEFVDMGKDKSENAQVLSSVLSTPIVYGDQLIAILNVDSWQPGKETGVHTVAVGNIFENSAHKLGPLLYETMNAKDK
ncbi:MAG: TIR domain-containing protein [Chloroflexia bacterium]